MHNGSVVYTLKLIKKVGTLSIHVSFGTHGCFSAIHLQQPCSKSKTTFNFSRLSVPMIILYWDYGKFLGIYTKSGPNHAALGIDIWENLLQPAPHQMWQMSYLMCTNFGVPFFTHIWESLFFSQRHRSLLEPLPNKTQSTSGVCVLFLQFWSCTISFILVHRP